MLFLQGLEEDILPVKSSFERNAKIALLCRHVLKMWLLFETAELHEQKV